MGNGGNEGEDKWDQKCQGCKKSQAATYVRDQDKSVSEVHIPLVSDLITGCNQIADQISAGILQDQANAYHQAHGCKDEKNTEQKK